MLISVIDRQLHSFRVAGGTELIGPNAFAGNSEKSIATPEVQQLDSRGWDAFARAIPLIRPSPLLVRDDG
jgi:hypothetical protein